MSAVNPSLHHDFHPERGSFFDAIREELRSAHWYAGSTLLHVVILLILLCVPTNAKRVVTEHHIIHVTPVPPEVVEHEPEIEKPTITENVTDIIKPASAVSITSTEFDTSKITDKLIGTEPTEVDVESAVEEFESMASGEEGMEEAETNDTPVLSVHGFKGTPRRAGPLRGTSGSLQKIAKVLNSFNPDGYPGDMAKGVCVVWLLDQSASMKDDQEAMARYAGDVKDSFTGKGRAMSAVVSFGQSCAVVQKPTENDARVVDAICNVEIDPSGIENTCQAITYVCDNITSKLRGWKKWIVPLSDESSSDSRILGKNAWPNLKVSGKEAKYTMLELARKRLFTTRTRLMVLGKESPFQSNYVYEPFVDNEGHRWVLPASRGPESAQLEVPVRFATYHRNYTGGGFTGALLSGYGVYDLAYLAHHSQGAYVIIDEASVSMRPMSPSERAKSPFKLDWKTMEPYAPLLASRADYGKRVVEGDTYGKTVWLLNRYFEENGDKVARWSHCSPPSTHTVRLECLRRRKALLERLCDIIRDKRASEEKLAAAKEKRQIANLDLYYCVLLADRMITDSWLDAFERYRGPFNDNTTPGHWAALRMRRIPEEKRETEAESLYQERFNELTEACNRVIMRHSNTPYAVVAHWIQKGPQTWASPRELVYATGKHIGHDPQPPGFRP